MRYNRVGQRSAGAKGFRLKRFSVQRLRARFFYIFNFLSRWRFSLESLKKSMTRSRSKKDDGIGGNLFSQETNNACRYEYRLRSFGRSNSFYSEAIADCLEFIKRSSVSVDDKQHQEMQDEFFFFFFYLYKSLAYAIVFNFLDGVLFWVLGCFEYQF